MSKDNNIRDLIYFDSDRIESLYSQLFEGLPGEKQETTEKSGEGGGGLNVPVMPVKVEGKIGVSQGVTETKTMHHHTLIKTEEELEGRNKLIDFSNVWENEEPDPEEIREMIESTPYVRIEGACEFRDASVMKPLMEAFLQGDAEVKASKLPKAKRNTAFFISDSVPITLSDAVGMVVSDRKLFAIQPFPDSTSPTPFTAYSSLREKFILDKDFGNVSYHYGTSPDVELTIFGMVTSAPLRDTYKPTMFLPGPQNQMISEPISEALEAIKPFLDVDVFASYPNIIVYPFAIYRTIYG